MEIAWFLAAFGCVAFEPTKQRIQLLVEKGVNCSTYETSVHGGRPDPFLRILAIRFCCGHTLSNQPFLDTARFGAEITRQMLVNIPAFFHYTDKRAAELILKEGRKPGYQLSPNGTGRKDVHTTLFAPKDWRGDGKKRITKRLDNGQTAAIICLSARGLAIRGRINPADGICLWEYIPPSMIDSIMLVWRAGERGDWEHKIVFDSTLPHARRYVDEPGKKVQGHTATDLDVRTGLRARNPADHESIMDLSLSLR